MRKLTFFCISWNRSLQESIFRYRNRFCAMVQSSRHRFKFVELIYLSRYAQENLYRKTPLAPKISFLVFASILFYSFWSEHQILFGLVKKTTENSKLCHTGIFLEQIWVTRTDLMCVLVACILDSARDSLKNKVYIPTFHRGSVKSVIDIPHEDFEEII